jgi:hypothetical protein
MRTVQALMSLIGAAARRLSRKGRGGVNQCMEMLPAALPLPARAGGLHMPHT